MSSAAFDDFLDHAASRQFRWNGETATHSCFLRHRTCGDEVTLHLQILDSTILTARFVGRGCTISLAAASMLCEAIEGRPVMSLPQFTAEQMLTLIGIPLTPARRRCGLLAHDALQRLLSSLDT